MSKTLLISCLFLFSLHYLRGQKHFQFNQNKQSLKIPFTLKSNLMIIELEIAGVPMNFLVDTGVNYTLLFDNNKARALDIKKGAPFYLRGLGNQTPMEAHKIAIPSINFKSFSLINQEILILPESEFLLSKRAGTHIDGIIGSALFREFPITINYQKQFLHLNPPNIQRKWRHSKVISKSLFFL